VAERLSADHAGRRPGLQHSHALRLRLLALVQPSGRLHDQKRALEIVVADVRVDLADVAAHLRADEGVGRDRRGALELAILLRQLVRRRDEHARQAFAEDFLRPRLMRAVGVAVDEHDGDGFDAERLEPVAQRREARLVERDHHLAVGAHALLHLEAQRPLDQRLVLLEIEIVGVGPVDAADLVDVAEAVGGDQRGPGAGSLQHGVDGDRRAVQEQARRGVVAAGLLDAVADAVDQPPRRRQRLAEGEPPGLVVKHRDVGEGAADVGRETHVRGPIGT
jgi:hypothetical protein